MVYIHYSIGTNVLRVNVDLVSNFSKAGTKLFLWNVKVWDLLGEFPSGIHIWHCDECKGLGLTERVS